MPVFLVVLLPGILLPQILTQLVPTSPVLTHMVPSQCHLPWLPLPCLQLHLVAPAFILSLPTTLPIPNSGFNLFSFVCITNILYNWIIYFFSQSSFLELSSRELYFKKMYVLLFKVVFIVPRIVSDTWQVFHKYILNKYLNFNDVSSNLLRILHIHLKYHFIQYSPKTWCLM